MAHTREAILAALMPDEINYNAVAEQLGAEAVPILTELIDEGDPMIAPKATFLVARIPSDGTSEAILLAARGKEPLVRLAAATVAPALGSADARDVLGRLLEDDDVGVRKQALGAIAPYRGNAEVDVQLERMSQSDAEVALRELADQYRQSF